jgi:hypothetical protein
MLTVTGNERKVTIEKKTKKIISYQDNMKQTLFFNLNSCKHFLLLVCSSEQRKKRTANYFDSNFLFAKLYTRLNNKSLTARDIKGSNPLFRDFCSFPSSWPKLPFFNRSFFFYHGELIVSTWLCFIF